MISYLIKRLVFMIPLLIGISIICFVVMHLAPGSPTDMETQMNPRVSAEMKERLRAMYDLDKPLHQQYLIWVKNSSYWIWEPLFPLIIGRLPTRSSSGSRLPSLLISFP